MEEDFNNGTAVVPNLDSIQDFKVLTNNFDAEYGNYQRRAGAGRHQVRQQSDSRQRLRIPAQHRLDARNYFATTRAAYDRNQYGGTLGGPIRKDKAFFFVDYQGTQMTQGQETGLHRRAQRWPIAVDDLSDLASQLTGKRQHGYWASQLAQKLGYSVAAGEPYYSAGCTTTSQCVFPNAT